MNDALKESVQVASRYIKTILGDHAAQTAEHQIRLVCNTVEEVHEFAVNFINQNIPVADTFNINEAAPLQRILSRLRAFHL
jgi:SepF-like predicted cell division protein (DUF552 family)